MVTEATLQQAIHLLVETARPQAIILFGSFARGETDTNSDLDFVVIEDHVNDRREETVRLLDVLESHEIPADVFVASRRFYEEWKEVPGTMLYEVAKEGKVVYEAN